MFKPSVKVFVGTVWLRNNDRFGAYFGTCREHVKNQKCDASFIGPYLSSTTNLDIRRSRTRVKAITIKLNELIEKFLKTDCSHIWFVDCDIEPPPYALQKLLMLDTDVATGVYPLHGDPKKMCGGRMGPPSRYRLMPQTFKNIQGKILSSKQSFVCAGNGCLLVKRQVYELGKLDGKPLRFRYFPGRRSSDIQFFLDSQNQGFEAKVHGDVVCGHLPQWPLAKVSKWSR